MVLKGSVLADVIRNNPSITCLLLEAHYRGWRLQNEHLRVIAQSRLVLTKVRLSYGQFSLEEFELMMVAIGSSLKSLNLRGSFIGGGSASTVIVRHAPALVSFFAHDCPWSDLEVVISGLSSLARIGCESFGGSISVSSLEKRASARDLEIASKMDPEADIEFVWDMVLDTMRNESDREMIAVGLQKRLFTRRTLIPGLTAGVLEWILNQKANVVRYFKAKEFVLVPVFEIPKVM